ncbi:MAG: hypothetical protein QN120_10940 [Armatimonadota bacterium]|nr:hypothetical protein [Armatimonadota bacterium]
MRRKATTIALAATVALALVSVPGAVSAQTVRLYLQRVAQRPAEILLVPGFLTILEFEDAVNAVATGNPSVVQLVDVTGGTVILRPRTGSGATDIVVSVGDVRALFRVRVASQPRTTHKYLITSTAPSETDTQETAKPSTGEQPRRPATQVAARTPATQPTPRPSPAAPQPQQPQAATEWDRFVATLTPAQQALLLNLMRELSLARLFEFLQALSPQQRDTFLRLARLRGLQPQPPQNSAAQQDRQQPQQATGPRGQPAQQAAQPGGTPDPQKPTNPHGQPAQQPPQAGSGPDWIDWQVTVQRTPSGTVLHYTLTNNGQRTLLTDLLKLRATSDGQPVRLVVTRVNPSGYAGRVNPGDTEAGTIAVQQDRGGVLSLEWHVTEVGSGTVYTLLRTVQ